MPAALDNSNRRGLSFSFGQYAAAWSVSRKAARARIERAGVKPDGAAIIAGNLAQTVSLRLLPAAWQSDLEKLARQRGFPDAAALLQGGGGRWHPPIPVSEICLDDLDSAGQWRLLLRPSLTLQFSRLGDGRPLDQWKAEHVTEARRLFGRSLTGAYIRDRFNLVIDRDRGFLEWHRLELYLPESPRRKEPAAAVTAPAAGSQFDFSPLAERLRFSAAKPTAAERANAMEYSFRHFAALCVEHPGREKEIKGRMLRFMLETAPAVARNLSALKRNWNRLHSAWTAGGKTPGAIKDGRSERAAGAHLVGLEADLQLIVAEAFHHDGRLALAIRKLRKAGKLSSDFVNRYTLDVRRNKSHVARSIREEIKARLTGLLAHRRSQFQVDMEGPRIARSHHYAPGDYFAADDVTFNIYFWTTDAAGRPFVTRGECLLFFDCRFLYPLGYVLTPGKYNGETVRRGILNIHDKHGLPHRAFIFEMGVWESRLIEGERPRDFLGWNEYEMGLRERGLALEVRHATTPQGKLIEGIFNILQQDQRNLPGFAGFNERDYGQEALQKFNSQVRRGGAHPSEKFFSLAQWSAALDKSLEEYAAEPQNGVLLPGCSPAEKWAEHGPLRKLPDAARFLLASHRVRARVKPAGIGLRIRGQRRFFYSPELGEKFMGREVFGWFNLEEPDLLTVSDTAMKQFISIRRQVLPAFDATKEQLAEAHRRRRGFMQPAKLQFDNIKHGPRRSITRDNVVDEDARALGEHIVEQTERFRADKADEGRQLCQLDRAAESAGIQLPENIRNPAAALRGVKLWQEAREETAVNDPDVHAKTYYLLPTPGADGESAAPSPALYWALWNQVHQIAPDLNRHALTGRSLRLTGGPHPTPNQMTPEQLAKMIDVFRAIIRDTAAKAL